MLLRLLVISFLGSELCLLRTFFERNGLGFFGVPVPAVRATR